MKLQALSKREPVQQVALEVLREALERGDLPLDALFDESAAGNHIALALLQGLDATKEVRP